MKKEMISFTLQILCAISCAVCSVAIDESFLRGLYAAGAVSWGLCAGMTLEQLLSRK